MSRKEPTRMFAVMCGPYGLDDVLARAALASGLVRSGARAAGLVYRVHHRGERVRGGALYSSSWFSQAKSTSSSSGEGGSSTQPCSNATHHGSMASGGGCPVFMKAPPAPSNFASASRPSKNPRKVPSWGISPSTRMRWRCTAQHGQSQRMCARVWRIFRDAEPVVVFAYGGVRHAALYLPRVDLVPGTLELIVRLPCWGEPVRGRESVRGEGRSSRADRSTCYEEGQSASEDRHTNEVAIVTRKW
jgi:hypothetical protein